MVIINAFLFIGLDLTARDGLHEVWSGSGLWWRMGTLIATGSFLSWGLNHNAGRIALASFVAFAGAGLVDAAMYHVLRRHPRLLKINGSNIVAAVVDSVLFPTIAFGMFMPWVIAGQFLAKVAGGFVWSVLLRRVMRQEVVS